MTLKWAVYGLASVAGLALAGGAASILYLTRVLPDAGPVPEFEVEGSPEQVERGAYLVHHVATCLVCHTEHDLAVVGQPLDWARLGAGGQALSYPDGVPGVVYPPNITPVGIGDWTDGELFHALTTGVTPDHRALHPVMPWQHLARSSRADVEAIIAYLRQLPPRQGEVPPRSLDSPYDAVINLWPAEATELRDQPPDPADSVAYGAYLAEIAGCEDCHSPAVERGQTEALRYAGGAVFPVPGRGVVRSSNLTPDRDSGIGRISREDFIGMFKFHLDNPIHGERLPDGLPVSVMPWSHYAGMAESDLGAIYDYLHTLPPIAHYVERFTLDEDSPPRNLSNMPLPATLPPLTPPRGALGSFCDSLRIEDRPAQTFTRAEVDPSLIDSTGARMRHRGHPGLDALRSVLELEPAPRLETLRAAVKHHELAERCGPLLRATPDAAEPPGR